jgi:hypothetical protein
MTILVYIKSDENDGCYKDYELSPVWKLRFSLPLAWRCWHDWLSIALCWPNSQKKSQDVLSDFVVRRHENR